MNNTEEKIVFIYPGKVEPIIIVATISRDLRKELAQKISDYVEE